MKHIQFLAASDRLNYGDLLFPLISKIILEDKIACDFKNYGLIRSDLSHFGALPTHNYRELERDNTISSIVIIGGGHVMFTNWSTLYSHINKFYLNTKRNKVLNFCYSLFNIPRIFFSNSKIPSPFAPYHLKGKLVYLSVGGNYNNYLKNNQINKMLHEASLLSVRDHMLFEQLNQGGFLVKKVPDTAIVVSKLFTKETLKSKLSNKLKFSTDKKYIIVQLGLHKGPVSNQKFVEDINVLREKGYQVLCMPIGLAADHEDYKVLHPLLELDHSWHYHLPQDIYEIMYLIANASYFFGTSLHGCITAFAYNTPFVPLNKKVKKLNNYTKTWWTSFLPESIDYKDLDYFINTKLEDWDSIAAKQQLEQQQKLVMQNYDKLIAL